MAKLAEKETETPEQGAKAAKGGKKKLLVIVAVVVVALAAAYVLVLKPKAGGAEPAPEPGVIVQLDPVTMNLTDGHFLKLTLALQATTEAKEPPVGAKAQDLAIHLLSNRDPAELSSGKARDKLKAELAKEVGEAYEGEVMGIYFTEFVMQ